MRCNPESASPAGAATVKSKSISYSEPAPSSSVTK
jgi:hypothetical protein